MKILYLTDAEPDYMSDDLLYGLRKVLANNVIDYPRKDVLYRTSTMKGMAHRLYGRGFHCFGLDDLSIDRSDISAKVRKGHFDLIINSSGWRISCPLHPRLVVVDEVLGQWLALAGARPLNLKSWLGAFVLFRLFDIWKPPPVRQLEVLPRGTGIVADDLMAGAYAALVLFVAGCFNLY